MGRSKPESSCRHSALCQRGHSGFRRAGRNGFWHEVKIKIAWIGKTKEPAIQALTDEYLKRLSHYAEAEGLALKDEAALLKLTKSAQKQTLILLDSRGKQLSSEELAEFVGTLQDRSLPVVFAIGPANGLSDDTRAAAST